jgi:hypothetical protein
MALYVVGRARWAALLVLFQQVAFDIVGRAGGAALFVLLEEMALDVIRRTIRHFVAPFGLFLTALVRSLPAH